MIKLLNRFFLQALIALVTPVLAIAEEDEEEPAVPSAYVEIEPAFVTNYGGAGRLRYMKVGVTLRVDGAEGRGEAQVMHHMPYIKDTLLGIFSIQTSATIGSAEGKETLRKQSYAAVSEILATEDETSYLQDLLFTSFIAHR